MTRGAEDVVLLRLNCKTSRIGRNLRRYGAQNIETCCKTKTKASPINNRIGESNCEG